MNSPAMLLDPRNGPAFDLPPFEGRPRTWLLASTPRTGSTLLCRTLWELGAVGAPKEYLNPMQIRDWEVRFGSLPGRLLHVALRGPFVALAGRGRWSDARLRDHVDRIRAHRTAPNGWFGMKLHWHHHVRWFVRPGRPPESYLGPVRWIVLRRRDHLAQAVSWARALQTGQWVPNQRPWVTPRYSRRHIARCLDAIRRGERGWSDWFASEEISPLELTYEDLTTDPFGTTRRALTHLDVQLGASSPFVGPPPTTRQADRLSVEWIRRARSEGLG